MPGVPANWCTRWNIAPAAPAGLFQALRMLSFVSERWQNGASVLANLLECTTVFQTLRASCLGSKAIKHCKLGKNILRTQYCQKEHTVLSNYFHLNIHLIMNVKGDEIYFNHFDLIFFGNLSS